MSTSGSPDIQQRLGHAARRIHPLRQPMLTLAIAGITGIAADRMLGIEADHWPLLVFVMIVFAIIAHVVSKLQLLASLLVAASAMGFYHHQRYDHFRSDTLARFLDEDWRPMQIDAIVRSPVERRPDTLADQRSDVEMITWQSLFVVEAVAVRDGFDFRPASGRARVVVNGEIEGLLYGDRIRMTCHLQRIPPPSNPGEVNLQKIYREQNQLVRIHVDAPNQIETIQPGAWSIRRVVDWIGNRGQRGIIGNVHEDSAALAEALVLGRRQAVDRSVRDRLLETGTIHLLAVSGLHVGIVALAVTWLTLMIGLSRTVALSIIIGVCLAYMLITGARPPVVRAATLISIFLIGRLLGRRVDPLNTLAAAAVLLMLIDPLSVGQVGTHLSFLAVATIVLSGSLPDAPVQLDPLDKLLQSRWAMAVVWIKNLLLGLKQLVSISFWIWCIGLPLVWYHFHVVTPISIVANVLLWIPLTVALISGLVTAIAGGVWMPAGAIPGHICNLALQSITWLVDRMAQVDGGYFWLPSPRFSLVLLFYGVVLVMPLLIAKRYRKPVVLAFIAVWIVGTVSVAVKTPMPDRFVATFIDVGHGTSVLMQFPDGQQWLYDAGRLGDPAFARWPIESVLWSEGIRHLDGIVVSHADSDHYNAIIGLSERFSIGQVVGSHELFPSVQRGVIELQQALSMQSIAIEKISAGDVLLSGKPFEVMSLHPPEHHLIGKDNANSIVLRIDCFGHTVVLPGDLESPGTALLLAQDRPAGGGVLMAPHHGSLSQDVYPILRWADPSVVIASGGRRASDPRVISGLAETNAKVYITQRDGAIRVIVNQHGIGVRTWRDNPW